MIKIDKFFAVLNQYILLINDKEIKILDKVDEKRIVKAYPIKDIEKLEIHKPFCILKGCATIWIKDNRHPDFTFFISDSEYNTWLIVIKHLINRGVKIRYPS